MQVLHSLILTSSSPPCFHTIVPSADRNCLHQFVQGILDPLFTEDRRVSSKRLWERQLPPSSGPEVKRRVYEGKGEWTDETSECRGVAQRTPTCTAAPWDVAMRGTCACRTVQAWGWKGQVRRKGRTKGVVADGKQVRAAQTTAEQSTVPVWEMDFCSRPILDERKKKVWELLICTPDRSFVHAEYFPNNKINSAQLKEALKRVMDESGQRPEKIRYFRSQMQTIIAKALKELEVKPVPSKRCVSLMGLIEDRLEEVYKKDPGYDGSIPPLINLEGMAPENLPDALRGEQWAFVQIDVATLKREVEDVKLGKTFGEVYDLSLLGLDGLPDNALVPGVAVFTARAFPLAVWTNGLDLASLNADTAQSSLILQTGINNRWRYAAIARTPDGKEEAEAWEAAKKDVEGLHFLAVQTDPEADSCAGFWLLQDREPPKI